MRIVVLMHRDFLPPSECPDPSTRKTAKWKTEFDVVSELRAAGHEVVPLGVDYDLNRRSPSDATQYETNEN